MGGGFVNGGLGRGAAIMVHTSVLRFLYLWVLGRRL